MSSYAKDIRLNRFRKRFNRRADALGERPGFGRDFLRDDSGAMLVFGVYAFLIILMVAGIGIDFMRFERDRSRLQGTLDRAVLAAADLDQPMQPEAVVQDYFEKSGLGDFLTSVTVDQGLGYRVVSASASTEIKTQFMHMNGVDTLVAPAAGTAEERIDGVEISLVLDVSGSMSDNNRLPNLINAAREFVDTMDENSAEGDLSISIVPYATQVSVPQALMEQFQTTEEHRYSNCINFEGTDFHTSSMSYDDEYQRTMHFDPWSVYDGLNRDPKVLLGNYYRTYPVCEADAAREVLLMQNDPEVLKAYISNLTARGSTSIDVGMKWGTALLDPSLRLAINDLTSTELVPSEFANLPTNYDDGETLKVIVLMTDGQNEEQFAVNEGFREGPSDVFINNENNAYSIYSPAADAYFWPGPHSVRNTQDNTIKDYYDKWADHPYGENSPDGSDEGCIGNSVEDWVCEERDEPGSAINIAFPDLWAHVSLRANANLYKHYSFMSDSEANTQWNEDVRNRISPSTKDARTEAICDAAKGNNIIVFTIGFDAKSRGQSILKYCASSDAHFFEVTSDWNGDKIRTAFSSIASSIRKLRLTQ